MNCLYVILPKIPIFESGLIFQTRQKQYVIFYIVTLPKRNYFNIALLQRVSWILFDALYPKFWNEMIDDFDWYYRTNTLKFPSYKTW